jgi:NAD(P)-dependent dehydrogenase (short-subunit alcohol dehydrogenase family)
MSNYSSKGTALITGASTGIGAVYADRLTKRGYDLVLVARNEARLKALAARLKEETGRSVTPLRADLNDKADLAKVERLLREDQAITMLVNNAGIGAVTPLLETDIDKMDELIALNVSALTRLTYAVVPALLEPEPFLAGLRHLEQLVVHVQGDRHRHRGDVDALGFQRLGQIAFGNLGSHRSNLLSDGSRPRAGGKTNLARPVPWVTVSYHGHAPRLWNDSPPQSIGQILVFYAIDRKHL